MNITNLIVLAGVFFLICLFSGSSKSWNLFCFSLIALAASVIALGYRLLGGT